MTDPKVTDPHGLLQAGEPLASIAELAPIVGVSRAQLHRLLGGPLYERVRFVHYSPGPWRYCIADVRAAVEAHRPAIEARRQRAVAIEAEQQRAKAARLAEKASAPPKSKRAPEPTPPALAPSASSKPGSPGPEVVVVRRRQVAP